MRWSAGYLVMFLWCPVTRCPVTQCPVTVVFPVIDAHLWRLNLSQTTAQGPALFVCALHLYCNTTELQLHLDRRLLRVRCDDTESLMYAPKPNRSVSLWHSAAWLPRLSRVNTRGGLPSRFHFLTVPGVVLFNRWITTSYVSWFISDVRLWKRCVPSSICVNVVCPRPTLTTLCSLVHLWQHRVPLFISDNVVFPC